MNPSHYCATIRSNNIIAKGYYSLCLDFPADFSQAKPGQFVHIRIGDGYEPLLRRPFSIHRFVHATAKKRRTICMEIIYAIKGKGTRLLSAKKPAETLDIIGPLGHGFEYETGRLESYKNILIAGGMGIAPLLFLAQQLKLKETSQKKANPVTFFLGAKTGQALLREKEIKELGCVLNSATDDGSKGYHGTVTSLFARSFRVSAAEQSLRKREKAPVRVFACGPKPMLVTLAKFCLIHKIPLQVSLEEFMGCGIGACLGCAIQTKNGYKRVCTEGPVFNAQDIVWEF